MDRTDLIYATDAAYLTAKSEGERVAKAKKDWDALKNDLAALLTFHTARGTHNRGFCEAAVEDADASILMLLDAVQGEINDGYSVQR